MSVADLFADYFSGKQYDTIEEYNADVIRFCAGLEDELGSTERFYLRNVEEVCKENGIEIKER